LVHFLVLPFLTWAELIAYEVEVARNEGVDEGEFVVAGFNDLVSRPHAAATSVQGGELAAIWFLELLCRARSPDHRFAQRLSLPARGTLRLLRRFVLTTPYSRQLCSKN
jgi:hypothetical protein